MHIATRLAHSEYSMKSLTSPFAALTTSARTMANNEIACNAKSTTKSSQAS